MSHFPFIRPFYIDNLILLALVLWFLFARRRQITYRLRWALWRQLHPIWIVLVIVIFMADLARWQGHPWGSTTEITAGLGVVARIIWLIRPRE